jgi:hypothetical protein
MGFDHINMTNDKAQGCSSCLKGVTMVFMEIP